MKHAYEYDRCVLWTAEFEFKARTLSQVGLK